MAQGVVEPQTPSFVPFGSQMLGVALRGCPAHRGLSLSSALGGLAAFLQDSQGHGSPPPAMTTSTHCTEPSACQCHTLRITLPHAERHTGTRGAAFFHEGTGVSFLQLQLKHRGGRWAPCGGGTRPSRGGFRPGASQLGPWGGVTRLAGSWGRPGL